MRRMVLFTAFYALLSLDSLFWVGLFLDSNRSDNPGKHTVHDTFDGNISDLRVGDA